MKEKKATISAKGASAKQWADLMLELNLMKKAWRRYVSRQKLKLQELIE